MRRLRPLLRLACLALAALLATGYFVRSGIGYRSAPAGSATAVYRVLGLEEGRIQYFRATVSNVPPMPPGLYRVRSDLRAPDLRRSLWEFDAHVIPTTPAPTRIVAFPIWCLLVPLLIGPAAGWWRRRRWRGHAVQGFPVDVTSPTPPAAIG